MNHTLIMLFAFAICASLCACEINPIGTSAKLKALQRAHYHGKKKQYRSAHAHAAAQGLTYVSPQWLSEYRSLESEHGDYTIPDDHRIQVEQDGKIKVPHTVVKHFNDLSKAPTKAEPPPQ